MAKDNIEQKQHLIDLMNMEKQTAVEWLLEELKKERLIDLSQKTTINLMVEQAKEMEKQDLENKVIHFAEWLTKKHTTTLMIFYEQFEEEFYK